MNAIFFIEFILCLSLKANATVLLEEKFDSNNFTSRGWQDAGNPNTSAIDNSEHITGSASSLKFHWIQGGNKPNSADGNYIWRHKITPTSQIYVSYWIKHSSNWVGSGTNVTYHPHVFYILTNVDDMFIGPAYTHLTTYIEENRGYPQVGIQDGMNIIPCPGGAVTCTITGENRSVAGCNGIQPTGQIVNDCYDADSSSAVEYWNGLVWRSTSATFYDSSQKNQWHFVESYFQLNTIQNGVGQANGVVRHWLDGNLVIDHSNVIFRTAQHPNMQYSTFMIGPWIGPGSPIDQTFWVDDLFVATERPTQLPNSTKPKAPVLRVQ